MTVANTFGIDLYNLSAYRHFYFFNCIENKRTQSAIETIKINYVFEVNIFASEVMFGIISVFLKRISVSTKSIVADIEQICNCLAFIIENKSPLF